jgi:hypothetical protein
MVKSSYKSGNSILSCLEIIVVGLGISLLVSNETFANYSQRFPDTFDPRKQNDILKNLQPHPVTGRLIDSHPGRRTKPMRVICLGMSRTGTMSFYTALQKLGCE